MAQTKKTTAQANPASAFLRMAAFNMVVCLLFFGFYLMYRGDDGERSVLILVASGVGLLASMLSVVAYAVFSKKIEESRRKKR